MGDRGTDLQSLQARIPAPRINTAVGTPQVLGQISSMFAGLTRTLGQRVSAQSTEKARLAGLAAEEGTLPRKVRRRSDVVFNEGLRNNHSVRITSATDMAIAEAAIKFPENPGEFSKSINEFIDIQVSELKTVFPEMVPSYEARSRTDASTELRRINAKTVLALDNEHRSTANILVGDITSHASINAPEILTQGPIRDSHASRLVQYEAMLHMPMSDGSGRPIFSPAEAELQMTNVLQASGFQIATGALEQTASVPNGPKEFKRAMLAGELKLFSQETEGGKFGLIDVPIAELLGNRAIVQLASHADALQNKQDRETQTLTGAAQHELEKAVADAITSAKLDPLNAQQLPAREVMKTGMSDLNVARAETEFAAALQQGNDREFLMAASALESQAYLDELEPEGEGFAAEAQRKIAAESVVAADQKFRSEAGADFAIREASYIEEMFTLAFGPTPQGVGGPRADTASRRKAVDAYTSHTKEFQRGKGIEEGSVRILPHEFAVRRVQAIHTAANSVERLRMVRDMDEEFGEDFPRAVAELQKEGLNRLYVPLTNVSNTDEIGGAIAAAAIDFVTNAEDGGWPRLRAQAASTQDDPGLLDQIERDLMEELAPFLESLGNDNAFLQQGFKETALATAFFMVGFQGGNAKVASKQAARIVQGDYEILNAGASRLRLPTRRQDIDIEGVKRASRQFEALVDSIIDELPDDQLLRDPLGVRDEGDVRDIMRDSIKNYGGLQTQPDEARGVTLLGEWGIPVATITWEELAAFGRGPKTKEIEDKDLIETVSRAAFGQVF